MVRKPFSWAWSSWGEAVSDRMTPQKTCTSASIDIQKRFRRLRLVIASAESIDEITLQAQKLDLIDKAIYAYKRSLFHRNKTADDHQAMWILAQLYFQKEEGGNDGIRVLYSLYEEMAIYY